MVLLNFDVENVRPGIVNLPVRDIYLFILVWIDVDFRFRK